MTDQPRRVAIVVNPSKFGDLTGIRLSLGRVARQEGWDEPVWYETSVDDPGCGPARRAVDEGANLVCALGGDGTVRSVASGLRQTDVPLGLLPGGTGNLLARNLGLPVDDLDGSFRTALTGAVKQIDVGEVTWDGGHTDVFLVMCGAGLDAETMAEADETVKARVGWPAYVLSGLRALFNKGFRVTVEADGERMRSQHARMVLIGNCGELTGGATMMPEAKVDDGILDAVVVSPRGVVGWGAVVLRVLTGSRRGHAAVQRLTSHRIEVTMGRPTQAELDGDAVGEVRSMRCVVREGVLAVKVLPD